MAIPFGGAAEQPSLFVEKTEFPVVTDIEIICGDCCGDGTWPKATRATVFGTCSVCGGRSYVNAESFGLKVLGSAPTMAQTEMKMIYDLAGLVGLVTFTEGGTREFDRYIQWLRVNFEVDVSRELTAEQRIQAINLLRRRLMSAPEKD